MHATTAVTGAGALGTVIAAALHDADRPVVLCARTAPPSIRIDSTGDGTSRTVNLAVATEPAAHDRVDGNITGNAITTLTTRRMEIFDTPDTRELRSACSVRRLLLASRMARPSATTRSIMC